MKLDLIDTPKLLAYTQLLEKFGSMHLDIYNNANYIVENRQATKSYFAEFMEKADKIAQKNDDLLVILQLELDKRMKKDIGVQAGIKTNMNLLEEFNDLVEKLKKDSIAKAKADGTIPLNT